MIEPILTFSQKRSRFDQPLLCLVLRSIITFKFDLAVSAAGLTSMTSIPRYIPCGDLATVVNTWSSSDNCLRIFCRSTPVLPRKLPLVTCLELILQPEPQHRSGVHSISTSLPVSSSTTCVLNECLLHNPLQFFLLCSCPSRNKNSVTKFVGYLWVVRIEDLLGLIRVASKLYLRLLLCLFCRRPPNSILDQCPRVVTHDQQRRQTCLRALYYSCR